jgi:hypothetical protein
MEVLPVSEIWGVAISCKAAILCTPVPFSARFFFNSLFWPLMNEMQTVKIS